MLESKCSAARDVHAHLAYRIKALRLEQGLSLEALAAKSDVSRSMLSLIERGESSPTAVVLDKIATGLGVVLATLFEVEDAPENPVSRCEDQASWRDPASGYLRRTISPVGFSSPFQIVEVVMPARASVAYETGAREAPPEQQIWVQEGRLEVTVGSARYTLAEGDCLAMRLDAPTAFHNPTPEPTRYIVVVMHERLSGRHP